MSCRNPEFIGTVTLLHNTHLNFRNPQQLMIARIHTSIRIQILSCSDEIVCKINFKSCMAPSSEALASLSILEFASLHAHTRPRRIHTSLSGVTSPCCSAARIPWSRTSRMRWTSPCSVLENLSPSSVFHGFLFLHLVAPSSSGQSDRIITGDATLPALFQC